MLKIPHKQPTHLQILVFLLLFAFLLAACGGGAEPTQAPASEAEVTEQPAAAETEPPAEATEPPAEATQPPTEGESGGGAPSFSADIQPIFNGSCASCHGSRASGGVQLNSYDNLMASNVVNAGDSAGSVLWQVVDSGIMPKAGQQLSAEQVQLIADWINAGANND
jgi:mono/diheme cytochrome c family protein